MIIYNLISAKLDSVLFLYLIDILYLDMLYTSIKNKTQSTAKGKNIFHSSIYLFE